MVSNSTCSNIVQSYQRPRVDSVRWLVPIAFRERNARNRSDRYLERRGEVDDVSRSHLFNMLHTGPSAQNRTVILLPTLGVDSKIVRARHTLRGDSLSKLHAPRQRQWHEHGCTVFPAGGQR